MKKIRIAREILLAFDFLGIPSEMFASMKKQFGGLEGLHNEMANRLS